MTIGAMHKHSPFVIYNYEKVAKFQVDFLLQAVI